MKTIVHSFVFIVVCCPAFILIALASLPAQGQETFGLLPPPTGAEPRFACAEAVDGKVRIIETQSRFESRPVKTEQQEEDPQVQFIEIEQTEVEVKSRGGRNYYTQNYQVHVPYTETHTFDGKQITLTKVRTEIRTRSIPIPDMTNMKVVEYQTQAVASEQVWSGGKEKTVRRLVTSTEAKAIPKDHEMVKVIRPLETLADPAKLKFYRIDGNLIEPEKVLESMTERVPILLLSSEDPPPEYFRFLLKPETVLIFQKPKTSN